MLSSARYVINEGNIKEGAVDTRGELLSSLERITTYNPPVYTCSTGWAFHGLYTGPTSIAYLFYRLYSIYPEMDFKGQSLLEWAAAYLKLSSHIQQHDPDPNHCGVANETLAHCAIRAAMTKDPSLVNQLCSYRHTVNSTSQRGSNEWLYGRAGYLYFLRLAQSEFGTELSSASEELERAVEETVQRILDEPQPWMWHGSQYLGAAHGTVGIICQVVLSQPAAASSLRYLLSHILTLQYPSGNIPSSIPVGSDELVQFCHGSPGFTLSLQSIAPHFPMLKTEIGKAIDSARQDVWTRGLLTKSPSLCHGIAGNALALDSEDKALLFVRHMTTSTLESQKEWIAEAGQSDKFASLYTGEAGRAWVWARLDSKLPLTCIGYNDL